MGGGQIGNGPKRSPQRSVPYTPLHENSTVITPMAARLAIRKFRWDIRHFTAMEPDREAMIPAML